MRRWAGIPALILLAACSGSLEPTQDELKKAWDARNVAPVNFKADIVAYMRSYLNDPRDVKNAAVSTPALKTLPGDPGDRIVSCVRYSSKRVSTGQYAATKTGIAVFTNGRLDRFIETPIVVQQICKDAEMIAFPELQAMGARAGTGAPTR